MFYKLVEVEENTPKLLGVFFYYINIKYLKKKYD